jgi:hypothetical protein
MKAGQEKMDIMDTTMKTSEEPDRFSPLWDG